MWQISHSFLNQKKIQIKSTLWKARVIESSRYRELALSRFRIASKSDETFAKEWKSFEMMTAYFVMNKAFHAAHLKHFESSASWALNIPSHFSFFFSFLLLFSLVCSLSVTRHLLDLFIELIVTNITRIRAKSSVIENFKFRHWNVEFSDV